MQNCKSLASDYQTDHPVKSGKLFQKDYYCTRIISQFTNNDFFPQPQGATEIPLLRTTKEKWIQWVFVFFFFRTFTNRLQFTNKVNWWSGYTLAVTLHNGDFHVESVLHLVLQYTHLTELDGSPANFFDTCNQIPE